MPRLFIVGTGGIAGRHANVLKRIEGAEVVGVCDIARDKAEQYVGRHQFPARVFTDTPTGLDATRPDAVVLLTPRGVRRPVVEWCVERRLPIIMEKPPCHDLATGQAILELLTQSRLVNSVAFPTRYDEALDAVRARIGGERISLVTVMFQSPMALNNMQRTYPDGFLVERSGGLVGDQGIHYVDAARWIAQSEPRAVRALGTNRFLPLSDRVSTRDVAGWVMEMANGVIVVHAHTWGAKDWVCRIQIVTDRSSVIVDSFQNSAVGTVNGEPFEYRPAHPGVERSFELEQRAFLRAVETGDMSGVRSPYADALESYKVTEEINRQLYGAA